jgi:hypothetical protein
MELRADKPYSALHMPDSSVAHRRSGRHRPPAHSNPASAGEKNRTSPPNENCRQQARVTRGSPKELSTDGVYPGQQRHRNSGNSWGHHHSDGLTTRNPKHGDVPTYQARGVREKNIAHKTRQTLQPCLPSAIARHSERSTKSKKPEEACITHPNCNSRSSVSSCVTVDRSMSPRTDVRTRSVFTSHERGRPKTLGAWEAIGWWGEEDDRSGWMRTLPTRV